MSKPDPFDIAQQNELDRKREMDQFAARRGEQIDALADKLREYKSKLSAKGIYFRSIFFEGQKQIILAEDSYNTFNLIRLDLQFRAYGLMILEHEWNWKRREYDSFLHTQELGYTVDDAMQSIANFAINKRLPTSGRSADAELMSLIREHPKSPPRSRKFLGFRF